MSDHIDTTASCKVLTSYIRDKLGLEAPKNKVEVEYLKVFYPDTGEVREEPHEFYVDSWPVRIRRGGGSGHWIVSARSNFWDLYVSEPYGEGVYEDYNDRCFISVGQWHAAGVVPFNSEISADNLMDHADVWDPLVAETLAAALRAIYVAEVLAAEPVSSET